MPGVEALKLGPGDQAFTPGTYARAMDRHRHRSTTLALAWSGLLPFFLAIPAGLGLLDPRLETLLTGYTLAILAFMCGTMWAESLARPGLSTQTVVLVSNAIVLLALASLYLTFAAAMLWMAGLFTLHLVAELRFTRKPQPPWYRRMRAAISVIVIFLLGMAGLLRLVTGA